MRIMTRRKKGELPEGLNNKEFERAADKLIEGVRQFLERTEGFEFSDEQVHELVIQIVERRL